MNSPKKISLSPGVLNIHYVITSQPVFIRPKVFSLPKIFNSDENPAWQAGYALDWLSIVTKLYTTFGLQGPLQVCHTAYS